MNAGPPMMVVEGKTEVIIGAAGAEMVNGVDD